MGHFTDANVTPGVTLEDVRDTKVPPKGQDTEVKLSDEVESMEHNLRALGGEEIWLS